MKLFYSPSYSGFVFADKSKIMFNQKIVDTAGLVQVIELHAGMNTEGIEDIERIVEYYQAMKTYMQANPENVLKASFDVDALSVAKECLLWRDTLTFAGWNKSLKAPSKRMEVLSGVEEYFSSPSLGERLLAVTKAVQNGCSLPQNLCIETPVDYKLFSPLESGLIQALADRGVAVTIKELPSKPANSLNAVIKVLESSSDKKEVIQKDDSFNILHFEEQDDVGWVASFDTIPYETPAEFLYYKGIGRSCAVLRTCEDLSLFFDKIEAKKDGVRRNILDLEWSKLVSCIMSYRLGVPLAGFGNRPVSIPYLDDPDHSVAEKVAWINTFNASQKKKFTENTWKDCRKQTRASQILSEPLFIDKLKDMVFWTP